MAHVQALHSLAALTETPPMRFVTTLQARHDGHNHHYSARVSSLAMCTPQAGQCADTHVRCCIDPSGNINGHKSHGSAKTWPMLEDTTCARARQQANSAPVVRTARCKVLKIMKKLFNLYFFN